MEHVLTKHQETTGSHSLKRLLTGLLVSGMAMFWTGQAHAGAITVVGDISVDQEVNFPIYENLLGSGSEVLFSREAFFQETLLNHFNSEAGITPTESGAELTNSLLDSVDMLVVTQTFNAPLAYTSGEIAAAKSFLEDGGNILTILEGEDGASVYGNYNAFLSSLGSSIEFTGSRYPNWEFIDPLEDTPISDSDSGGFRVKQYNTLSGGQPVAIASNGTAVAYEEIGASDPGDDPATVPEPSSLATLSLGLLVLGVLAGRRKHGISV
ncbi:PEP-CTERM sorting domain-containing protein [Marinobacter sp. TBZ242]|uniref:PEP-CTERM sorting domain-containing protein n=1 Tax=Marinobacter azerbaijanicus TaxID=3050455 RepID=A0ABT7IE59_9GAMM|nr:PEP-CTERM sorting domain-containing protein [Marinobacter sp. TBZ242]MDL0432454.1 PEP-CTERM sorting domain-containing protein [Marinobacter sp. TBZ242]